MSVIICRTGIWSESPLSLRKVGNCKRFRYKVFKEHYNEIMGEKGEFGKE